MEIGARDHLLFLTEMIRLYQEFCCLIGPSRGNLDCRKKGIRKEWGVFLGRYGVDFRVVSKRFVLRRNG